MQLEPGPIPELNAPVDPAFLIEDPGFGVFVRNALSDTDGIDLAFLGLEAALQLEADSNPGAEIDAVMGDASLQLDGMSRIDLGAAHADDVDQITSADELVLNAWAEQPAEAFTAVPDPLPFPGAPAPTPQPGAGTIKLSNLTRPGDPDWRVGDLVGVELRVLPVSGGFSIIANLPLTWWVYDEYTGGIDRKIPVGSTDKNGFLNYTFTLDASWLGRWGINVQTPGGLDQVLVAQFHLIVNATSGPITATPHKVTGQLINNTRPGHLDFLVGDTWTLIISGSAGAPVLISSALNGQVLSDLPVPNTNNVGETILNGVMDAASIGNWQEWYIVGGVRTPDPITFTVR